jgi:hypothetical protein
MRHNLFNLLAGDFVPALIVDPSPSGFVLDDDACGLGVEHIVFFGGEGPNWFFQSF